MGCCVSKCRGKKKCCLQEFGEVEDKLVISKSPIPPIPNKISPFPVSPTPTTSSCGSGSSSWVSSSSSSSASSVLSSRDRSFSNEFLWACVKENPHIIRINSIKEASLTLSTTKSPKRARTTSPFTLTPSKTKSFPIDRLNPTPSRRFNVGDNNSSSRWTAKASTSTSTSKRIVGPKINALNSVSPSLSLSVKDNFKSPSPLKPCLSKRETVVHRISSKIDERALRAAMSTQEPNDTITLDDIHNPLISLDCFIFL